MSKQNHATTDNLSKRAHESLDQVAKSAGHAEELIRREAESAQVSVRNAGKKAKESSEETLHSANDFVRGNPLLSLVMALGAGALLYAFKRR